jgi:hypothetical protein
MSNEKSNQGTLVKPEELEEIIPRKRETSEPRPKKEVVKTRTITLNDTPEDVLSLDQKGYLLTFDDDPERFLELPLEVVQNLSERNRKDYALAAYYTRKMAEERLNPPSGVEVIPGYASARQQMKIIGGKRGKHYAWQRPDQLRKRLTREGYKVCNDPDVKTFNSTVGSTKTLGDMRGGDAEQVLLEVPQESFDARQQALADKAVGKSRAIDEATQEALARMGGRLPESFGARANTPRRKEVIRKKVR